jgi:hypothetical protein
MVKRGSTVNRATTFLDAVKTLEAESVTGVQSAVDHFVEALKAGGESLAIRPVDGRTTTHRADNPSAGGAGRDQFCIQLVRKTKSDASVTFTLIDIWVRHRDLPDQG